MKKIKKEILKVLINNPFADQKTIAENCGYPIKKIEKHLKGLRKNGFVDDDNKVTSEAKQMLEEENKIATVIQKVLNVDISEIKKIKILKKGMTNRSYKFLCKGKKYIIRTPGEGTDQLINRKQETEVYAAIKGKGFCDDPVYIDASTGYKVAKYLKNVRSCDPNNESELIKCMSKLRELHDLGLKVKHEFDIFGQIDFYESLWDGNPSVYEDYHTTKKNVFSLIKFIDKHSGEKVLTHIDAVPDNFLFYQDEDNRECIQLTDWEYSGMQDPHVDIAMFCIYSLYDRNQIDRLINIYFVDECDNNIKIKIYCYISACGLLWSNWCEYKKNLGIDFGEYALAQYEYAKEYFQIVNECLNKSGSLSEL